MLSKINIFKRLKEAKEIELRYEKLLKARDILLRSVNHEIRSPLSRMKLDTELIDDAEIRKSLNKEIDFIQGMVDELMQIEKVQISSHNFSRVFLKDIVANVMNRAGMEFNELNITVDEDLALECEESLLETLFKNLIENAFKYKSEDGGVELRAIKKNQFVEVVLINQGPEIPSQELPYIFEPFFRSSKVGNSTSKAGHGLGLSLCMEIIKIHDGSIRVTSKKGLGTIFKISIPLSKD